MIKGFIILFLFNGDAYVISPPYLFRDIAECRQEGKAVMSDTIKNAESAGKKVMSYTLSCGYAEEVKLNGEPV